MSRSFVPVLAATALAGALLSAAAPAFADTLLVDRTKQPAGVPVPTRGMSMADVEARFGAPSERLDEVIALLPGAERPTILPLAGDQQRVAMHMVSSETLFWETMEKLKALGASSILVLPIEKMME